MIVVVSVFMSFVYAEVNDALEDVLWEWSEASQYQVLTNEDDVESLVVSKKWLHVLWLKSKDKPSVMIRIAQTLLRWAIMLWVLVFVLAWIRFLIALGDVNKAKWIRNSLLTAAMWFIIAFGSWVILQLILSLWPTLWGA
jgi:hypothetical protein